MGNLRNVLSLYGAVPAGPSPLAFGGIWLSGATRELLTHLHRELLTRDSCVHGHLILASGWHGHLSRRVRCTRPHYILWWSYERHEMRE